MSMANQPQDEQTLIQSAQGGDVDAFNELVLRYQDYIYTVTYRIMGEPDTAADAAQDAFLNAYRKLHTYRGGKFIAWLARIATNLCYDELRRRQRRPMTYLDDLTPPDSDDGPPLPSDEQTPEQAAQQLELREALQQCIQGLKADQRVILVMSDVQGMSYQEIADSVNTQLGTVKSRLSRARVAVRNCLQGFQELLPDEYRQVSNE